MKPQELESLRLLLPEVGVAAEAIIAAPVSEPIPVPSGGMAMPEAHKPPPRQASIPVLELAGGRWASLVKANGLPRSGINGPALPLVGASGPSAFAAGARAMSVGASREVQVLSTREEVRAWKHSSKRRIALVPTMGGLHEGHLELIDEAKRHADEVLVSIFVNPTQFAPHEDFDRYPRTLESDLELLRARGATAAFAPAPTELYPLGAPGTMAVVPRFVEAKSEAACRPHFFTGVATVCLKLFNLCEPDVVVFGQKDAMQCAVIANMLEDLLLNPRVELVVAATSREEDGLARSSRNSYLTPEMRRRAPAIYAALASATGAPGATPGSVRGAMREDLERGGWEVSYVSVADLRVMDEKADDADLANSVVSVACLLRDGDKECRLIDNVVIPAIQ